MMLPRMHVILLAACSAVSAAEPPFAGQESPPKLLTVAAGPGPKAMKKGDAVKIPVGTYLFAVIPGEKGVITWTVEKDDGIAAYEFSPKERIFGAHADGSPFGPAVAPDAQGFIVAGLKPGARCMIDAIGVETGADGKPRGKRLGTLNFEVPGVEPIVVDEKEKKDKPDPKPKPVGTSAKIQIVVVEETQDATAERASWFGDAALQKYLNEKKHPPPFVVDQNGKGTKGDALPANVQPYVKNASGKSLPWWVLVAAEGEKNAGDVLYNGPQPKTPAKLIELLEQLSGR